MSTPLPTRAALLRGLAWFTLANALLFKLITAWFWSGLIEPAVDTPAAIYRVVNGFVHWPLLALLMIGVPAALCIVLLPRRPVAWIAAALFGGLAACVMAVDAVVFSQYRMHLGPYVWGLVMGGAGAETFLVFSPLVLWGLAAAALAILGAQAGLFAACRKLAASGVGRHARPLWTAWAVAFVGTNLWYAWADAHYQVNITQETGHFPFYRPMTSKRLFRKLGITDFEQPQQLAVPGGGNRALFYPSQPLECPAPKRQNVLLIVVDAWRGDHLDPVHTPHMAQLIPQSLRFTRHISGGNVTRFGIFSIFYGLPGSYWFPVLGHQTPPVMMGELVRQQYDLKILGSSPLVHPEFDRTVFSGIAGLRLKTPGDTPYERDRRVSADMVEFLSDPARGQKPFFGFLWLNSVHSYAVPPDSTLPFRPSWEQVNHMALGPDFDKTPYLNRYRNALHFVDAEVGKVLEALRQSGQMDKTLLIVTSDHGEEFNDTGKNYWGHNGNFSPYQLHVPLLVRGPGWQAGSAEYLTTHNDLAPTVLTDALGCSTPSLAYSSGWPLRQTEGRRDFLAVVDYNDTGLYEADRITLFSPFGGFPVYSHDYDRLEEPPRMDRVRAVTEEMLRFSRKPGIMDAPKSSGD